MTRDTLKLMLALMALSLLLAVARYLPPMASGAMHGFLLYLAAKAGYAWGDQAL